MFQVFVQLCVKRFYDEFIANIGASELCEGCQNNVPQQGSNSLLRRPKIQINNSIVRFQTVFGLKTVPM